MGGAAAILDALIAETADPTNLPSIVAADILLVERMFTRAEKQVEMMNKPREDDSQKLAELEETLKRLEVSVCSPASRPQRLQRAPPTPVTTPSIAAHDRKRVKASFTPIERREPESDVDKRSPSERADAVLKEARRSMANNPIERRAPESNFDKKSPSERADAVLKEARRSMADNPNRC